MFKSICGNLPCLLSYFFADPVSNKIEANDAHPVKKFKQGIGPKVT